MGRRHTSACTLKVKIAMEDKTDLSDLDVSAQDELDVPDDPGPALLGNTPVFGTLRRQNDMPVLRDELKDEL